MADWEKYNQMCQKISDGLSEDDIGQLTFLLRQKLKPNETEKIKHGQDLVQALEKRNLISEENVSELASLLQQIKCGKLLRVVQSYMQSTCTRSSTKLYNQDKYDIEFIKQSIVENFVKTSDLEKITGMMEKKRAALIKGSIGSGKTQMAFWYASEFSSKNEGVVWNINCKSAEEIHLSLATLLSSLNIHEEPMTTAIDISESIQSVFELVLKTLTTGNSEYKNHLIILNDIRKPKENPICDILNRFIQANNIYVIGTSNTRFPRQLSDKYTVALKGMTEKEAVELLKSVDENDEEKKELVRKLDFQPLAISLALSYIKETKLSISSYLKNLEAFQTEAHHCLEEGRKLEASYKMTFSNVENDLSQNARRLLGLIPFLSYSGINTDVFKYFLPENMSEKHKEIEINKFLISLQDYSLASVLTTGRGRILSMHSNAVLVLANSLEETSGKVDKNDTLYQLLQIYCKQMAVDVRLVENMHRNVLFLDHACLLLTEFLNDGSNAENRVYECYLCLCLGLTLRLYGNTEIIANEYFKRGRKIIFKIANIDGKAQMLKSTAVKSFIANHRLQKSSKILIAKGSDQACISTFLKGEDALQQDARTIFNALLENSTNTNGEWLETLVIRKYRTKRELEILFDQAGLRLNDVQGSTIRKEYLEKLVASKSVMPLDKLTEPFLVELLVLILYNSSSNKWWSEEAKHLFSNPESVAEFKSKDSLIEFQLCFNLGTLLGDLYKKIYPSFHPICSTLVKRSGVYFFLQNENIQHTVSELNSTIQVLEELLSKDENLSFTLLGTLNMGKHLDVHHTCTVLDLQRECYMKLSHKDIENKDKYIKLALEKTNRLETHVEDIEDWAFLPRVHLAITEMCMVLKTPEMSRKARKHFRCATMHKNENDVFTRHRLKSYKRFIEFCIGEGEKGDLDEAEILCNRMLEKFGDQTTRKWFNDKLDIAKSKRRKMSLVTSKEKSMSQESDLEIDAEPYPTTYRDNEEELELNSTDVTQPSDNTILEHTGIYATMNTLETAKLNTVKRKLQIEEKRLEIEEKRLKIAEKQLEATRKSNDFLEKLLNKFGRY